MTKTNPSALPVLDPEQVMRDMSDDGEIYVEVGTVFLEDLVRMDEALQACGTDREAWVSLMHELSNSLGAVGARRGENTLRTLERQLDAGGPLDAALLHAHTVQVIDEAQAALRAWIAAR